jgi:Leucine-rich repeat (LRR) protein
MTHLRASDNKLTDLLDFKPPKCLEYVDLSYNKIAKMKNLFGVRFLKELNLDNN